MRMVRPGRDDAAKPARGGEINLACSALNFLQRRRIFQIGSVAKLFTEISGSNDAAHHFRVSRLWDVADKNHLARCERFAEIARDVLFQFGGERGIALCAFFKYAEANQRFAFDGIRDANRGGFAHLRVRDKDRFENFWRHESILSRTNARFLRLF